LPWREYHLYPGDMVLIAPREAHSCNPSAERPRSYHMLYLDEAWCLQQLGVRGEYLYCAQTVLRTPSFFTAFMHIISLMEDNQVGALQEAVRALLVSLPACRLRCNRLNLRPPANDAAGRYSAAAVAGLRHSGTLRKETLIRQFKLATGLTPGAWVNNARVEFAKVQLRAGRDIADVGYQSGFADQSHFHRTFVSFTSSTPRQYALGRSISDNN
jgi:AraC-like DNA-binding protein